MTTGGDETLLRRAFRWHRPLMAVAALMTVSAVACCAGLAVDHRTVTGLDVWDKPLKFSISILLHCTTWAWLIAHLPRWRRAAGVAGSVIAVALVVEQVAIVVSAAAGTTSHFNVSTPLHAAVWGVMAAAIVVLCCATLVTSAAVFAMRLPERSTTLAVRAGVVLALAGLGLGFLMTSPTAAQLADFHGIAGAHTVGLPDGGPGLPVLGWSTVGGDLRIPHFVGMHALQLLPLLSLALSAAGRRVPSLRDDRVRTRLVGVASAAYAAVVAAVTAQALSGDPLVHPTAPFVAAGAAIAGAALVAGAVVLLRPA